MRHTNQHALAHPRHRGSAQGGFAGPRRNPGGYAQPAPKHPPNRSGDPQGWNTQRYTSQQKVAQYLMNLGYPFQFGGDFAWTVMKFQSDYNLAHKLTPAKFPGKLKVDGIAGKHTLNGLDWVLAYLKGMPKSWQFYVAKFKDIDGGHAPAPGQGRSRLDPYGHIARAMGRGARTRRPAVARR